MNEAIHTKWIGSLKPNVPKNTRFSTPEGAAGDCATQHSTRMRVQA